MNTITVSPIAGIDLKDVSQFLHTNLNSKIPVKTWRDSFHSQWSQSVPNFGFQLKNGGDLVGVICAIYSDQIIDGKIEFLCNPHSWCVLKDYRKQSINLVLAVLQQKGYHFTMFTPNPDVATVFRYLKFKDLSNIQTLYLHHPSVTRWLPKSIIISDLEKMKNILHGNDLKVFNDHSHLGWLKHIVFGHKDELCHVIYKTSIFKKLSCANILYISNAHFFEKYHSLLSHYFFISEHIFLSIVDARFLDSKPKTTFTLINNQPKLFLSESLDDKEIKNVYSELMALDLM